MDTLEKVKQWFRNNPTQFIGEAVEKTVYTLPPLQETPTTF
jgi:hypothetical protein